MNCAEMFYKKYELNFQEVFFMNHKNTCMIRVGKMNNVPEYKIQ